MTMPTRVASSLARSLLAVTVATLAYAAPAPAQPFDLAEDGFPNVRFPDARFGAPYVALYDDGVLLASISYRYSQRHHDSPWLVVRLQLGGSETAWNREIRQEDIVLVRPDGIEVPPATQRERRRDVGRVRMLLNERANWPETLRFDFPGSRTFARGSYWLEPALRFPDRGAAGNDVFFLSPDGSWEEGVHALVVTVGEDRAAKLPIILY